jgi:hypothetical protein
MCITSFCYSGTNPWMVVCLVTARSAEQPIEKPPLFDPVRIGEKLPRRGIFVYQKSRIAAEIVSNKIWVVIRA